MQRRIEGLRRPLPLLRAMVLLVCLDEGAEPGDAARGERAFQRCYACHSVDPHEATRLQGPSLYRIIDRPAASIAGFEYSDALRRKGAAGLVWDAATLERYLADRRRSSPARTCASRPCATKRSAPISSPIWRAAVPIDPERIAARTGRPRRARRSANYAAAGAGLMLHSIKKVTPEKTRLMPSSRPRTQSAADGSCCQIMMPRTTLMMPPTSTSPQPDLGRI